MNHAAQTLDIVVSFFDYVALLPLMMIAFVVFGLIRGKD
jgi:hypothetical protein